MNRAIVFFFALLVASLAIGQDIDVDKTSGLVKVDGKDAFYLIKKKKFLSFDISVQNLENKELAFMTSTNTSELGPQEKGRRTGVYYVLTFSETANRCNFFPEGFSILKDVAKQFLNANLIKDQKIDPKAERAFLSARDGHVFKDPESINITVNTSSPIAARSVEIDVKGNKIYNNAELIGSFKMTTVGGITSMNIYSKNDLKVASATHVDADPNADWSISTTDDKKYQVLYSSSSAIEKLFKFMVEKAIL